MTDDYSNREIDFFMKEVLQTLNRVEAQTVKTNGRVSLLEKVVLVLCAVIATAGAVTGSDVAMALFKVLL